MRRVAVVEPEAITAVAVRRALRAVRRAASLRDCPLLELSLVASRLAADARPDTPDSRECELASLLADKTWEQLERRRGRSAPRARTRPAPRNELAELRHDLAAKDPVLEAWAALHFRYFSELTAPVHVAAASVGASERTLRRRLLRGYELLADVLRAAEKVAAAHVAAHRLVTFLLIEILPAWRAGAQGVPGAVPSRVQSIVRAAVEPRLGRVRRTSDDSFRCEFDDPAAALAAAVDAQRALAAVDDGNRDGVSAATLARMAIHCGRVLSIGGDRAGPELNRAARIMRAVHPGQILLSAAVQEVVRDCVPDGVALRDLGRHPLAGQGAPEQLWQVLAVGLPDVLAPLAEKAVHHARDRIVVDECRAGGRRGDARATLLQAIRDGEGVVPLSVTQFDRILREPIRDEAEYRLARVAEWSQPRYCLGQGYVALTLLLGGATAVPVEGRAVDEGRFDDLRDLLDAVPEEAVVLLGPPGCGKSTLLRRLELDLALTGLRDEGPAAPVTFLVSLGQYAAATPGDRPLPPGEWLAERWRVSYPALPPLEAFLSEGRMILLLDALNEMPSSDERDAFERVGMWKAWLPEVLTGRRGNRVVFACRAIDYSAPLSTPTLRVPQVRIEPLTDTQVLEFLVQRCPARRQEVWSRLRGTPELELFRSPYLLSLLAESVDYGAELPLGRPALFTTFVRRALRREVERGRFLFEPGDLLGVGDVKQLTHWQWRHPWDLPDRGLLVPKLAALAHAMQRGASDGERSQVRLPRSEALAVLDAPRAEAVLAAGEAIGVLDEDPSDGAVGFAHQRLQEYFAARVESESLHVELVRADWQADAASQSLEEACAALDPSERLPPLPRTGWEHTARMAAPMAPDTSAFVSDVAAVNLALAGAIAVEPDVRPRLDAASRKQLGQALCARITDSAADVRDRIACGLALGVLGDPRLRTCRGPFGEYLLPPFAEVPAGAYPVGDDEPVRWRVLPTSPEQLDSDHVPHHVVQVDDFLIARFEVTNAEWARFIAAGGYEDDRWWQLPDARRWRNGELASESTRIHGLRWRRRFLEEPGLFDRGVRDGLFDSAALIERWRTRLAMDAEAFERAPAEDARPRRMTEPLLWTERRFANPAQPVVGVCWYEALAYCAWLAEQSGLPARLPTEVEWEAAARGFEARTYPWGEAYELGRANTAELHVRCTTPVGAFPAGNTSSGVADMAGNAYEWTSSLWGEFGKPEPVVGFRYPYDPTDGREDREAPCSVARVARGGSWNRFAADARPVVRNGIRPDVRNAAYSFRIVLSGA